MGESAPFGVALPTSNDFNSGATESTSIPQSSGAPEGSIPGNRQTSSTENIQSEAPKSQELLDLEKLERFRFQGKEWNFKDLLNANLRYEDYSKKTMEVAEARKYTENFEADFNAIKDNPELMEEFRNIYPKFYIEIAERMLERLGITQNTNQGTEKPKQDVMTPEIKELLSWKKELEGNKRQAEVERNQAWLDKQFTTLTKKYPNAVEEMVLARAEMLETMGHKLNEKLLERLFKEVDGDISKRFGKTYQEKVNKQLEANKSARDIGAGGGTMSGAPKTAKNIKEVTNQWLSELAR